MSKLNRRQSTAIDLDEGISLADVYTEDAMSILLNDEEDADGYLQYLEDKYCYLPIEEVPEWVCEVLGWGAYAEEAREEWDRLKKIAHGYQRWAEVMVA